MYNWKKYILSWTIFAVLNIATATTRSPAKDVNVKYIHTAEAEAAFSISTAQQNDNAIDNTTNPLNISDDLNLSFHNLSRTMVNISPYSGKVTQHNTLFWDSILRTACESSSKKKKFCLIRFVKLHAILIKYRFKVKNLPIFDIRIDPLPEKCWNLATPSNCAEATACTRRSGYYRIKVDKFNSESFLVECDAHTQGGDWTIIQKRLDGSENFYRTWSEYKVGFGDIDGEHFIGMDKLYALTNYDAPQELLILMVGKNTTGYLNYQAKYSSFAIGTESQKYKLKRIGRYSGNAGDMLKRHVGLKFTTKDVNNGVVVNNCAVTRMGAWWYDNCADSNLNGHYGDKTTYQGINWYALTGYTRSLETVIMMIRRSKY